MKPIRVAAIPSIGGFNNAILMRIFVFIGCQYEKEIVTIKSQARCDTAIRVLVHF